MAASKSLVSLRRSRLTCQCPVSLRLPREVKHAQDFVPRRDNRSRPICEDHYSRDRDTTRPAFARRLRACCRGSLAAGYRPEVINSCLVEMNPLEAHTPEQAAAVLAVQYKRAAASTAIDRVKSECIRRGLVSSTFEVR